MWRHYLYFVAAIAIIYEWPKDWMVPVWAVHAAALVWPVLDSCWQALKPLPEADLEQFVQLLYFYVFYFVFAALHPWLHLIAPQSSGATVSAFAIVLLAWLQGPTRGATLVGDNLLFPRLHPLLSDPASDPLTAASKPSFFSLRGLLGEGFGVALQTLLVILVPSYLLLPAFIGQPLVSLLVSLSGTLLPSYLSMVAVVREDLWLARKQVIYWVVMVLAAVVLQALGLGRTYSDPAKEAQEQSQGLLGWLPLKPLFQVGFYFWLQHPWFEGAQTLFACSARALLILLGQPVDRASPIHPKVGPRGEPPPDEFSVQFINKSSRAF